MSQVIVNFSRFIFPILIGAVGGLAYGGAMFYMHDYYPVKNLDPQPEAFWMDKISFDLFAKLNKYRKFAPSAYRTALEKTDALLVLESALVNQRTTPVIEDEIRAQTLSDVVITNLEDLKAGAAGKDNTEMELEYLVSEIERLLTTHVENVRELCSNCAV